MKNIWFIISFFVITLLAGCSDEHFDKVRVKELKELTGKDLPAPLEFIDTSRVLTLNDGCQYYYWYCSYGGWSYMHKGDCNNPIHLHQYPN